MESQSNNLSTYGVVTESQDIYLTINTAVIGSQYIYLSIYKVVAESQSNYLCNNTVVIERHYIYIYIFIYLYSCDGQSI